MSNLIIQCNDVSGKVVNLEADNKVNLLSDQNISTQTSSSSNISASVVIAAQLGTKRHAPLMPRKLSRMTTE